MKRTDAFVQSCVNCLLDYQLHGRISLEPHSLNVGHRPVGWKSECTHHNKTCASDPTWARNPPLSAEVYLKLDLSHEVLVNTWILKCSPHRCVSLHSNLWSVNMDINPRRRIILGVNSLLILVASLVTSSGQSEFKMFCSLLTKRCFLFSPKGTFEDFVCECTWMCTYVRTYVRTLCVCVWCVCGVCVHTCVCITYGRDSIRQSAESDVPADMSKMRQCLCEENYCERHFACVFVVVVLQPIGEKMFLRRN